MMGARALPRNLHINNLIGARKLLFISRAGHIWALGRMRSTNYGSIAMPRARFMTTPLSCPAHRGRMTGIGYCPFTHGPSQIRQALT